MCSVPLRYQMKKKTLELDFYLGILGYDAHSIFSQKTSNGQDLFDKTCTSVHLTEREFFGLFYEDSDHHGKWLKMDKSLKNQLQGEKS